jgi:hypothetical protein
MPTSRDDKRRTKHLVVGTRDLSVGTLSLKDVTRLCRLWPKAQLSGKKEAGIPDGFGYIHIVTDTPAALVNVLRDGAKAAGLKFYEPEPEDLVEARLRPFLGLPAASVPVVSSIHRPTEYFKGLTQEAIVRASAAEKREEEAIREALDQMERAEKLAPLAERDQRLCRLVDRLRRRWLSSRLALQVASRPVPLTPSEFAEEWQQMSQEYAKATAEVDRLNDRIRQIGDKARLRGIRASTIAKYRADAQELKKKNDELEKSLAERDTAIERLKLLESQREPSVQIRRQKQPRRAAAVKPAKVQSAQFDTAFDLLQYLVKTKEVATAGPSGRKKFRDEVARYGFESKNWITDDKTLTKRIQALLPKK